MPGFPTRHETARWERDMARSNKSFIIVLNKCDLVSMETLEKIKYRHVNKSPPTVFVSNKDRFGTTLLRHKILETAGIKGAGHTGWLHRAIPTRANHRCINGVSGGHKARTSRFQGTQEECSLWMQVHASCSLIRRGDTLRPRTTNIFRVFSG